MSEYSDLMSSRYEAYKAEDYSRALDLASQAYRIADNDRDRAHALRDQAAALHRLETVPLEWVNVDPTDLIDESISLASTAIFDGIEGSYREKGASISWKGRRIMRRLLETELKTGTSKPGLYQQPNWLFVDALDYYRRENLEGEIDQYYLNDIPPTSYSYTFLEARSYRKKSEKDLGLLYAKKAIHLARLSESKKMMSSADTLSDVQRAKSKAIALSRGIGAYVAARGIVSRPVAAKTALKLKVV